MVPPKNIRVLLQGGTDDGRAESHGVLYSHVMLPSVTWAGKPAHRSALHLLHAAGDHLGDPLTLYPALGLQPCPYPMNLFQLAVFKIRILGTAGGRKTAEGSKEDG